MISIDLLKVYPLSGCFIYHWKCWGFLQGGGGGGEKLVKPLEATVTTDYKVNPSMALLPGFEPRQHYELLIHCLASLYTVFAPQS